MNRGATGLRSRLCYHKSVGIFAVQNATFLLRSMPIPFQVLRLTRNFAAQETAISRKLTTQLQASDPRV